jgi:hypothetical protein
MNKQTISRPEDISFSMWSKLAASMLGLSEEARSVRLEQEQIDEDAWYQAQRTHLRALAKAASAGDDTLADEHTRNVEEQLKAPIPGAINVDETQLPAPNRAAALPFGQAAMPNVQKPALPFRTKAAASAKVIASPEPREVDPSGETLPVVGGLDATMPFNAAGELRFLRLEPFAELSAQLRSKPAERLAILQSHGFADEAAFQQLTQLWATRFQESPQLRVRFEEAVAKRGADR